MSRSSSSPLSDTCFKICYSNSNGYESVVADRLEDLSIGLYRFLCNEEGFNIDSVQILQHYCGIIIAKFCLAYDDGLVLYNGDNYIKLSSIFPECAAIENAFKKKENRINPSCQSKTSLLEKVGAVEKLGRPTNPPKDTSRHASMLDKARIAREKIQNLRENSIPKRFLFDEDFEALKEKQRNERIQEGINIEKFRVFESDKEVYTKIKDDIGQGIIRKDEINPAFSIKYQIFEILEGRCQIDFESNNNINKEFDLFTKLYDVCLEECESKSEKIVSKVYVPHNYHYLSDEKKEEHSKKYKLTKKEFEEKYINTNLEDDLIESRI